ncbi:PKD domain-containing protein, partial [Terrimonas pollutisoli]|uniref:PKD domain-containing protein n=1 Tax=Terrimonas pollutisoli TaxID=3034147 RepID=UPI0023ED0171
MNLVRPNTITALNKRLIKGPCYSFFAPVFLGLLFLIAFGLKVEGQTCPSNISFTLQPQSQTVCNGVNVIFEATITGAQGTPNFDWQRKRPSDPGFSSIGAPSATTLSISNAGSVTDPDQTQYQVVISDVCGVYATPSAIATLTVNSPPTISNQPSAQTVGIGCAASFSVTASSTLSFTYQWRKNGVNISGATSDNYAIPNVAAGDAGNYDVLITNSCGTVTSVSAALNVNPPLNPGSHNTDPITACINYNPDVLNFNPPNTPPSGGLAPYTYQWQSSTDGGTSWNNISGATSATYDPTNLLTPGTYSYRVIVTDACGETATTTAKTITIVEEVTATISGGGNFCEGDNVNLNVTLSNGTGTYSYQWQSGTSLSGPWTNIPGATNATYSPSLTAGTYYYQIVVFANGAACNDEKETVTVIVNALPTANITGTAAICAGASTVLSSNATAGSGSISSYQWNLNSTPISGATSATYTATAAGNYTVTVTNSNTCSFTSAAFAVTVNALPTANITGTAAICAGASTVLSSNATAGSGSISSYQWNLNSTPISGATSATYTATAAGNYTVTVTNSNTCSFTSAAFAVTVNALPTANITGTAAICAGASTVLSSNATAGSGSISSYQWNLNSTPISGATSATYTATAAGNYTVTVTNSNTCSFTSAAFAVTVNA